MCKQTLLSFWTSGQAAQQQHAERDMKAVLQQALVQNDNASGTSAWVSCVACMSLTQHLPHVLDGLEANMVISILTSMASTFRLHPVKTVESVSVLALCSHSLGCKSIARHCNPAFLLDYLKCNEVEDTV